MDSEPTSWKLSENCEVRLILQKEDSLREAGEREPDMMTPSEDEGCETADEAVDTLVPVRQLSMQDHKNYTVAEGAPVQEILRGMLGPRCDENRDASQQLALRIRELEDSDPAKKEMKVEMWRFHGDGTTWVNATSIFKYIYTGARDNFSRMQKSHFQNTNIPHKLLEVPGVRTIFFYF